MSTSAKDQVESSVSEETKNSSTDGQSMLEKTASAKDSSKEEGLEKSESQAKDIGENAKDSGKEGAEKSEKGEPEQKNSGESGEGGEDEDRPRPQRKVQPSKEALEGPQGPPPKRYDYDGEEGEKKGKPCCVVLNVKSSGLTNIRWQVRGSTG